MGLFTKKKTTSHLIQALQQQEIYIKQITINSARDFMLLKHNLLDGSIMVANLAPLVKIAQGKNGHGKDGRLELQNYLQKIKAYCLQNGGSVSKLKESVLIITPNRNIKINSHK